MKENAIGVEGGTPSNSLKVTLVYTVLGEEHPFTLDIPLSHTPDLNLIPLAVTAAFAEIKKISTLLISTMKCPTLNFWEKPESANTRQPIGSQFLQFFSPFFGLDEYVVGVSESFFFCLTDFPEPNPIF